MSEIDRNSKLICIEPEFSNLKELKDFIEINKIGNVDIIDAAVGDFNGTIRFTCGLNGYVSKESSNCNDVKMIKLDNLKYFNPEFIKIDVKGYEGQAIFGMTEIISKLSPNLFVEIHPHLLNYEYSFNDIINHCKKFYNSI